MLYLNHQKEDTPEIVFDLKTNTLSFIGNSYPENCELVYLPVLDFLNSYDFQQKKHLNLDFHFNLINSTSVVYVAQIFSKLQIYQKESNQIKVKWSYDEFDEELMELGERFSSICKLPFTYNPVSNS
jgi:hypothetical protein